MSTDVSNSARLPSLPQRSVWLVGLVIMLLAGVGAWHLARRVPAAVLDPRNQDIYFSSDTSRVHANMVTKRSDHWRTRVHPLFSLQLHPLYHGMARLTGAAVDDNPLSSDAIKVGRRMSGLAAGLAAGLFYLLLRTTGVRAQDAVMFCALASVSAFALYWFTVPETYPWGSATIVGALALATIGLRRPLSAWWYVAASVLTLSITTTNWMAGLVATWTRFSWRKTTQWTAVALAITLGLALVQKAIFPSSRLFFKIGGEKNYVMQPHSGGPLRCWVSFFSHTIVMPAVTTSPHPSVAGQTILRAQMSAPGSAGPWGKVAVACWMLLLAAGIYGLVRAPVALPLRLALAGTLLGQLGLHTIYGAETFLYAAHYGPLLIASVALATLTRLRLPVLALTTVLILCLVLNNFPEFQRTVDLLAQSQQRLDQLPSTTP